MAGHSKWKQIKRKKAVADARRGAAFTKLMTRSLNATSPDLFNRATHIYYLWDDSALYVAVRAATLPVCRVSKSNASRTTARYTGPS